MPRAFLARRVAQGDLAAGLLRQEALVMDAARDQVPGLVSHPHLLRDDVAIAPSIAISRSRAAAQDLSNARRRINLPFLTPPQVAMLDAGAEGYRGRPPDFHPGNGHGFRSDGLRTACTLMFVAPAFILIPPPGGGST